MTDLAFVGQVIAWVLSALIGMFATTAIAGEASRLPRLLLVVIAPAFGFGISSLVWFLIWCRGGSGSPLVPLSAEFLIVLLLFRFRPFSFAPRQPRLTQRSSPWLLAPILVSFACALFYFHRFSSVGPYAGWDAWAIWNLHARALVTGGGRIWKTELFKLGWSHPDYPLLLPLTVCRLWLFAGREVLAAPASVAAYFTFGTAGVLFATLRQAKGNVCAALALVSLLASQRFLWLGFQEYADVPLGFYVLAAFCLLALADCLQERRLLVLAGFSAGLAAWTKNEGLLFSVFFLGVHLLVGHWRSSWSASFASFSRLALGAAVPVAVTIAYKRRIPAHSDVLSWLLTRSGWAHAFDGLRLLFLLRKFGETPWQLDTWFISSVAVLCIYVVLAGLDRAGTLNRAALTAFVTFGLLLVFYFGVYATSPATSPSALSEYLMSSLDRLYIQLWPAFVLQIFLMARAPFQHPEVPASNR